MSKRRDGYERSDGRWSAQLALGWENGKRKRKTIYAETSAELQLKVAAAKLDRNNGVLASGRRQTTGQFLKGWLEDVVRPGTRPLTYKRYKSIVETHLVPSIGQFPAERLTPQHVQAMLNAKGKAGLSPRTVHHMRAVLRTALNQAMRWGVVTRNVAALTSPPRVEQHQVEPLSVDEAFEVLDTVKGDRLEAVYVVALTQGMRIGEILGLQWTDVDLNVGQLVVRQAMQRIDGKLLLVPVKTKKSRRTLPLLPLTVDALTAHYERQLFERRAAGKKWQELGLVFTSTVGSPLDASDVSRRYQQLRKQADLPPARFHDLRHACTSLLVAAEVPAGWAMAILGHSNIATTMNIYSHVMDAQKKEAAARMGRLLTRPAAGVGG